VDRNQHLCAFLTWEDYFWHGVPQTSGETPNQAPDQPIATILGLFKKFLTRIGTLATMIATRSPPQSEPYINWAIGPDLWTFHSQKQK